MIETLEKQETLSTIVDPLVRFYYGTMRSGKTEKLLNDSLDYEYRTVFVLPEEDTNGVIESRAFKVSDGWNLDFIITPDITFGVKNHLEESKRLFDLIYDDNIEKVVVDEAQFLDPEFVDSIVEACRSTNTKLDAYGLLTDFHGDVFNSSRQWVDNADESICIEGKCELTGCENKSYYNCMRKQRKSPDSNVVIGDSQYIVLCPEHRELYKKAGIIE